jgi:hypothetical protein
MFDEMEMEQAIAILLRLFGLSIYALELIDAKIHAEPGDVVPKPINKRFAALYDAMAQMIEGLIQ